jgi:hypothetical protein
MTVDKLQGETETEKCFLIFFRVKIKKYCDFLPGKIARSESKATKKNPSLVKSNPLSVFTVEFFKNIPVSESLIFSFFNQ